MADNVGTHNACSKAGEGTRIHDGAPFQSETTEGRHADWMRVNQRSTVNNEISGRVQNSNRVLTGTSHDYGKRDVHGHRQRHAVLAL